jgi:uncharacterized protein YjbI with pentapeptide repeats
MRSWSDVIGVERLEAHQRWRRSDNVDGEQLVLQSCDLRGVSFAGADIGRARFRECDFTGADLADAKLVQAYFMGCALDQVTSAGCTLQDSQIWSCTFVGAGFAGAHFAGAELHHCTGDSLGLEGVNLAKVGIQHCTFPRIRLAKARLYRVQCMDSALRYGELMEADASYAGFSDCDLRDTNIEGLKLERTHFDHCAFHGTSGKPRMQGLVMVDRPDLSPSFDGTVMGTEEEILRRWGA